jgi:hypothetical protein
MVRINEFIPSSGLPYRIKGPETGVIVGQTMRRGFEANSDLVFSRTPRARR